MNQIEVEVFGPYQDALQAAAASVEQCQKVRGMTVAVLDKPPYWYVLVSGETMPMIQEWWQSQTLESLTPHPQQEEEITEVLEVIEPGAAVTIAGTLTGTVIKVVLRQGSLTYHIGYWYGNNWTEVELPESEVEIGQARKLSIGFNRGTPSGKSGSSHPQQVM